MHLDWQSALEGAAIWWVVSAVLGSVPPTKDTDPWMVRWFSSAAHAVAANLDKIKGINPKEGK